MKTKVLTIFALASLVMMSCKKTETATPAEPGSATITGTLYAPLDLGNDTTAAGVFISGYDNEFAPSGTKLTAIIDTYDLQKNPDNSFNYELKKFTAVVGDNGSFTFTGLPTYSEQINVEIRFSDFDASQAQFDPSNNPAQTKIYTLSDKNATIYDGASLIKEYTYTAN
ncbi:hypothetical protein DNU06_10610 [Putridiphycobacter roseus]|uniref:Type 1 periplasmic binding fold superfamily protein n=1 Tax=Putridiphycobacter roseus TaxID=2219161 RepID=A0A2W1NBK2_9FLAO|nr:hypothetical protein [Putridiphycobacter roseus]PZE16705.1 hypothetical protein DNU06_10610 [Putridiphycobacter roseus]